MRFSKQISTGLLIESQSGGDPNNPVHLQTLMDNAINGGIIESDIEVGYCTDLEHANMLVAKDTAMAIKYPLQKWKQDMRKFSMPRHFENHIKDVHSGVAGNSYDQKEYDAKIKRRSEKPY